MKIYLSLQETEQLVFKKILIVSIDRKKIKKAQKDFSISLNLNPTHLIEKDEKIYIFFSSIINIDLPKEEETLFINHYKLPKGLINPLTRKVKDNAPVINTIIEVDRKYLAIRNGLLAVLNIGLSENDKIYENFLNSFFLPSNFKKELINEIINHSNYPIQKIQVNTFKPESFYRYIWWGAFVVNNLLIPQKEELGEEKFLEIRKWLKYFIDHENIQTINEGLKNIPKYYEEEISCMIGYFVAVVLFEQSESKELGKDLKGYITSLDNINHKEVLIWSVFFQAIKQEELSDLHFIPSVQNELFHIEINALFFTTNISQKYYPIKIDRFDRDQEISEYVFLKEREKSTPKILSKEEVQIPFKNLISIDPDYHPGFIFTEQIPNNEVKWNTKNYCLFEHYPSSFLLKIYDNPSKCVFYGNVEENKSDYLKGYKTKPIENILKGKKAIILFLKENDSLEKMHMYSYFVKNFSNTIKDIVVVYEVNKSSEELHDISFAYKKDELLRLINRIFAPIQELNLVVKNIQNTKEVEIIRNLKQLLGNYKISQLEVVSNNFRDEQAKWLLQINSEYLIEDNNKNYYSFFN